MTRAAHVAKLYAIIKDAVVEAGHGTEIETQGNLDLDACTAQQFMCEMAWVILNSGMRYTVIAKKWPAFMAAFDGFRSYRSFKTWLPYDDDAARERALGVFNSKPKVNAIISNGDMMMDDGWEVVRDAIKGGGVLYLQRYAYIGPVTCFHLAKNIGLDVCKPDRHLVRMAAVAGYDNPHTMCAAISEASGDPVRVVDLVLWRYAVGAPKEYLQVFNVGTPV